MVAKRKKGMGGRYDISDETIRALNFAYKEAKRENEMIILSEKL